VFGELPLERVSLVLEGGGIEVDGSGSLLATERCLLAPTRNPGLGRAALEERLGELFGLKRVLWLRHGALAGDDTDSHIDTLARFCDARTIAYAACDDPSDKHYDELGAMAEELRGFRAADGRPYQLVALPWPRAKRDAEGNRMPATYANFLIINGAVLVPTYRDPADRLALDCLGRCFPGREIIGIDCLALIQQHGSLHCVTMQLPEGVLRDAPAPAADR
jgi:agmatine deiminase